MSDLILDSLEIRNFRGFQHLQIERLGRVNLIVGKNNIGKTSLLEALQLYARRGSPVLIWELIDIRDEGFYSYSRSKSLVSVDGGRVIEDWLLSLRYLFYGREDLSTYPNSIELGPANKPDEILSIAVRWYVEQKDESGFTRYQLLSPDEYKLVDYPVLRFAIRIGMQSERSAPLARTRRRSLTSDPASIKCFFRRADGVNREQIAQFWDGITLQKPEKDVLSALRILAPGVEGLSFVGDSRPVQVGDQEENRIPIVKMAGSNEPFPLRSLGDGMMRTLEIVLALVNARDGMVLVDEFENGLHYAALPELWELIFQLARHLNVQVFATTHSWDCIEAFQKAAVEDKREEGLLVRLSLKGDDIVSTIFDKDELGIITRERIEVR